MYVLPNFKTKKDLKAAVARGEFVSIFQPAPFGGSPPQDGVVCVEGPHYPKPHTWYGVVTITDGKVTKVT